MRTVARPMTTRKPDCRWGLFLIIVMLGPFAGPALAQVSSIDIVVPRKAPPLFQIAQMLLTVQVDTTAPIGFTLTPPTGAPSATANMSPGDPAQPPLFFGADFVRVFPPDGALDANDPRKRNYRVLIQPRSDFDVSTCQTVMSVDETWTLAVTGGVARIVNACLVSEDENTTSQPVCDDNLRVVPASEAVAEIGGLDAQEQSCRFGVEAMLVLDRSGSMSGAARPDEPASPTNRKIVSLREAVSTFTTALTAVRATETANGLTVPIDQMGVVIFNSDAADLPGLPAGLNAFDAALPGNVDTQLSAVGASGLTSIGDGLILAGGSLGGAAGNVRRVVLLMSDGKQNTNQRVSVVGDEIVTHSGTTACPLGSNSPGCSLLPNDGNYSVCSVTVGTGTAVDAQINQDVALAGDCFYLNSEADASELSVFFLNVLQSFLETSSWQTLVAGSGSTTETSPVSDTVPVTSTTQALSVTLMPREDDFLCLQVTAPDGQVFDQTCGSGIQGFHRGASEMTANDMSGNWQLRVEAPRASTERPASFYLMVLGDDVGTHARAEVLAGSFAPLEPIRVRVRLDEHGEPLAGLSGSGLKLRLASPSLTIGELMASVSPDTGGTGDDTSGVDAAIQNAVAGDPSILLDSESEIEFSEVEPGIYEAGFSIAKYGHVDLVLILRGEAPAGGQFIRQIGQTLYINAVPDPSSTEVQTQVVQGDKGQTLRIQLTPKTVGGFPVGPGWQNYYWLQGPGVPPFKLTDNLDGTYGGSINFSGTEPPTLSVHFIPDSVSISDEVPASELPSPLDGTTVLLSEIPVDTGPEPPKRWSLFLVLMLILLLVIFLIWRRSGTSPGP